MAKGIRNLVCEYCKKTFTPRRAWQKFCGTECKDLFWKELRREVLQIVRARRSKGPTNEHGE